MKCSIVILNWNGEKMLREYLSSVVQHSALPDCEVVVADNGSSDNSVDFIQKEFPSVRIIRLRHNYGFAEGYNRAIKQLKESEYVVLLNSDVEVTEGWLQPVLDYMDAHPEVAAAQPKIRSLRQRDRFEHAGAAGGYLDRLGYPFCRGRILSHVEEDRGQYDTMVDIFWASGACMFVRREVYMKEGGLDERFFAHMEEIDLCWRLNCRGYRLVCIPDSTVYHLGGGSLQYESPRKTYLNFRNNLLMIYKNMPRSRFWRVAIWRWLLDYAAMAHLVVTGKGKNAWAVVRARWDYHRMKPKYKATRQENRAKATVSYPATISNRSILWDYYFRGVKELG
ncbi:MAG: glycosyltransferase family 2 protein [Paludibacteraceae bacterium]|nr:glycosyltransferase family 2 protein [Paludibacteraceae bacterium]